MRGTIYDYSNKSKVIIASNYRRISYDWADLVLLQQDTVLEILQSASVVVDVQFLSLRPKYPILVEDEEGSIEFAIKIGLRHCFFKYFLIPEWREQYLLSLGQSLRVYSSL